MVLSDNVRRIGKPKPVNAGHDLAETLEINDPIATFGGKPIRQKVQRVVTQTLLDQYKHRRLISDDEFKAGDKLRALIYIAGLSAKVTVNYDSSGHGANHWAPYQEGQAGARLRMRDCERAVGRVLWPLLYAVVTDELSASSYMLNLGERNAKRAQAKGMDRLRVALQMLHHHFPDRSGRADV